MSFVILLALVAILVALGCAGVFMLKRSSREAGRESRMAKALAWRVGLSISLFLFVLLSYWMGWITPTGLPVSR